MNRRKKIKKKNIQYLINIPLLKIEIYIKQKHAFYGI